MKLSCEVQISYILAQGGSNSTSKRAGAVISIGRKGNGKTSVNKGENLYLTVSTTKNVSGSEYKVKDNIAHIFTKFVNEGKATIRFKDPFHDLAISKADPLKLKEIITLLKLNPKDQKDVSVAPLLPPKMRDLDKPPTRLIIKSRSDYPIGPFPSSLSFIMAANIKLNRIDKRILQLENLQHLNLSDNVIKTIPEEIHNLSLVELHLAGNQLVDIPVGACYGRLATSLKLLDLSRNKLTHLPHSFTEFKSLIQLKLDCNQLQVLPRSFGKLNTLRYFSASSNNLCVLPFSFSNLRLESLDLFNNPFRANGLLRRHTNLSDPGLLELSARAVRKYKLPYDPQTLPIMLCHYLDSAKKCICGKACFDAYLHYVANLQLHKVASTVTSINSHGLNQVPIELFLCSAKCLKLWK